MVCTAYVTFCDSVNCPVEFKISNVTSKYTTKLMQVWDMTKSWADTFDPQGFSWPIFTYKIL